MSAEREQPLSTNQLMPHTTTTEDDIARSALLCRAQTPCWNPETFQPVTPRSPPSPGLCLRGLESNKPGTLPGGSHDWEQRGRAGNARGAGIPPFRALGLRREPGAPFPRLSVKFSLLEVQAWPKGSRFQNTPQRAGCPARPLREVDPAPPRLSCPGPVLVEMKPDRS